MLPFAGVWIAGAASGWGPDWTSDWGLGASGKTASANTLDGACWHQLEAGSAKAISSANSVPGSRNRCHGSLASLSIFISSPNRPVI
jgi:hypothetical protein